MLTFSTIVGVSTVAAQEPTPEEQYLVELLNRARANPAAEAKSYNVDLNEGPPSATISATAKQPLAVNTKVMQAARNHLAWMNSSQGEFGHTAAGVLGQHSFTGAQPWDRLTHVQQAYSATSENLALSGITNSKAAIDQMQELLIVDKNIPGRQHRVNILNEQVMEVGVAFGSTSQLKLPGGQVFARGTLGVQMFIKDPAGSAKLTGVAIDDKDGDQFYTIGEGLGGVEVEIVGTNLKSTTWASGGYNLDIASLADGEHQVRFTRAGKIFETSFTRSGDRNVKVDALAAAFTDPPAVPVDPPVVTPPVEKLDYALGAYWEFDDMHNATANGTSSDSVSSAQGIYNGAVLSADRQGRSGQLGDRALDTSGGAFVISGESAMQVLNRAQAIDKVTISFWQKLNSLRAETGALYAYADESGNGSAIGINAPWGDGNLYFATNGCCDGATQELGGLPPAGHDFTDGWHHYVFVKDGPNKSVWVDGVKAFEGQNTAPLPKNFTDLIVGVDYGSGFPDGLIDELAIFASALPLEAIGQLADGTKASEFLVSRPVISRLTRAANTVQLSFNGTAGETYAVEHSPDLRNWSQIGSVAPSTTAEVSYNDTDANRTGNAIGYYRVVKN